ncbi:MAG: M3 family metallopeptidase [Bacteroidota bacterium]
MKKQLFILAIFTMVSAVGCKDKKKEESKNQNPFLTEWDTPYGVAPFDKIKNEHFLPAFQEGIKQQQAEVDSIINNSAEPNFENTIEALEHSGSLLSKVSNVFYILLGALTNEEMQKIAQEIAPQISTHSDNINLNPKLWIRIKKVYEQKDKLKLNPEQQKLLEETYKDFVRGGADLDSLKQKRFREINQELSVLSLKFSENVLAENNRFKLIIDKKEDLAGLPESLIAAGADAAKENKMEGKWIYTLQNPSIMPFLQYSQKRVLREKILKAYFNRGNNGDSIDNKENINKIVNLRLERANLLGYPTHAAFILDENMAKTEANVYKLLDQVWTPAIKVAQNEAKELQAMMTKDGVKDKLQPWDWRYYAEKLRKEKYDLDEESLRPYFELNNVRNGAFELATRLYGLKFIERKDIPSYHADAQVYEVQEADGSHKGLLYMDFFPRESKRGGAWMNSFRKQSKKDGKNISPIISVVCNFSKPTADQPALLTFDEVNTLFHEFGHALQGLLSNCTYNSLSGTSVPRDFVELPSQIMENWAGQPEVLALYAKHFKTGVVIPKELIDKLGNSKYFNQGFETSEFIAAAYLDMNYHTIAKAEKIDVLEFEKKALAKIGLIPEISVRYKSTYYNHIFSGGYSAGYYSYTWAGVLDADAFNAFVEKGIFDKATATSFRKNILERGGTLDAMEMYKAFRGSEPKIEPYLKRKGLQK